MAGVYGEIDSRAGFDRVLKEARAITRRMLKARPDNEVIEVIDTQLDAMERWTSGGRTPTQAERDTISIGLIAARELADVRNAEVEALLPKLYALNNYFEDWPSDDEAKKATDEDFFDG
ncbi:MAG: hypothetical protein ABSC94_03465 [Polyangiaceae bacterium]|jgi:hypothetical protein